MREKEKVLILDASYDEDELARVVKQILVSFPLDLEGKRILVKPNLLGPFPPESAIITHPLLIKVLVEALEEKGSRVIVGDNPGIRGYGMVGKVGKVTGLEKALGDRFVNLAAHPLKIPIRSRFLSEAVVSEEVLETDVLISMPKFKTHVTTVITGAIKNSLGFLVGGEKVRMHALAPRARDFGELLVDIYQLRVPDLVIMDAIEGIEGNGPSSKDVRYIGKVLASTNGIAVDTVMAAMMGVDPDRVPMLRVAGERGLGPVDVEKIDLSGKLQRLDGFRLPSTVPRLSLISPFQRLVFSLIRRPRFRVDRDLCSSCGNCSQLCPAGAISKERYPRFDSSRCIQCYCCYELCPEHAITINQLIEFLRRGPGAEETGR
jgi:uncharacterized protein (DUF362 family)/Pyruvate/2-oxoacid:ferredoxin oxidoreductase delta subunit